MSTFVARIATREKSSGSGIPFKSLGKDEQCVRFLAGAHRILRSTGSTPHVSIFYRAYKSQFIRLPCRTRINSAFAPLEPRSRWIGIRAWPNYLTNFTPAGKSTMEPAITAAPKVANTRSRYDSKPFVSRHSRNRRLQDDLARFYLGVREIKRERRLWKTFLGWNLHRSR